MIVDVLHPASVVHVPPRARTARHAFVAARTPVEIPVTDAEPRHVRCLVSSPWHEHLHEHEGALWRRLVARAGIDQAREVSPGDWTRWLAGGLPDGDYLNYQLAMATRMTPLSVMTRDTSAGPASLAYRGVALDVGAQRSVEGDGRGRAAAAVSRFLAEETLVTRSSVFVRYRPLAVEGGCAPEMTCALQPHLVGAPYLSPRFAVADMARMKLLSEEAIPRRAPFLKDLDAVAPFVEDDADLAPLANWIPTHVAALLDSQVRGLHPPGSPRRDEAVEALREAERRSWRGDLGGFGREDARECLEWALATARQWLGIRSPADLAGGPRFVDVGGAQVNHHGRDWCNLALHLDGVLARTAPEPVPDDDEAMEGLGMGLAP